MNTVAGVGKQVVGELGDVVKKAAKDTAKVGADVIKGTIENVVGGGDDQGQDKQSQTHQGGVGGGKPDPMMEMKQRKEVEKRRGLNRIRQELADYVAKKKQEEGREEMMEERQEEIRKDQEKQVRESERDAQIAQAQRSGGGTGEISRKKH